MARKEDNDFLPQVATSDIAEVLCLPKGPKCRNRGYVGVLYKSE